MQSGGVKIRTKVALGGVLSVFAFTTVFGLAIFSAPAPAYAQAGGPDPIADAELETLMQGTIPTSAVTANNELIQTGLQTKASTWDAIKITLANSAAIALLNASQYFVTKIAYDTATYIASGGSGQKPLFVTDWKKYAENTALDAAGEALGTFSSAAGLTAFGINLCNPTDPKIALNIKLGFINGLGAHYGGAPKTACSWNQISKNWDSFTSQSSNQVLSNAGVMFTPGQSSLSSALEFNRYSLELMDKNTSAAITSAAASGGFKAVTDTISGQIKTPASVVQDQMHQTGQLAEDEQLNSSTMITGSAFQAGAYGVLSAALKTFTNTLTEKLMKRVFDRGLISAADLANLAGGNKSLGALYQANAVVDLTGQAAASLANADILTAPILSTTNYDPVLDLSSCPTSGKGPDNCAMDNQFLIAVNRAAAGSPVTLSQAIDQGFINGSWSLIPASNPKNSAAGCYLEAFCYSNLVKMRTARIIPIGWEMAANSPYNDPNNPVTLKTVMDGFNDCPTKDDGTGHQVFDASQVPSPTHPWCHLIDPDWVLLAPKAMCRMLAPGPTLSDSNSAIRSNICVDAATCINEDAKGNCVGGYGYCTREATTWNIDADACESQYASCQALTSADGKPVAYDLNTVSAGICSADNAGCRAYSSVQNAIPNGDFEDISTHGEIRDWSLNSSSHAGLDARNNKAYHGHGAAWVDSSGKLSTQDGTSDVTGLFDSVIKLVPGQQYQVSFSSLASQADVNNRAFMVLSLKDTDGNGADRNVITQQTCGSDTSVDAANAQGGTSGSALFLVNQPTNLGYQTRTCTFTAPTGYPFAKVSLSSNGSGRVYFDDVSLNGVTGGPTAFSAAPLDSIFLNGKAQACTAAKAGCSAFVNATPGALNLIANSGFESSVANKSLKPTIWIEGGNHPGTTYERANGSSYEGDAAIKLGVFSQRVALDSGAHYAVSAYSRNDGGGSTPKPTLSLGFLDSDGNFITPPTDSTCSRVKGNWLELDLASGSSYSRSACDFVAPAGTVTVNVTLDDESANSVLVDAVQLELGSTPTVYHDGYAADAQRLDLKVPPTGLACTGASTDPADCANYAKSCRREEAGCELYTPKDGSTPIPAVTSPSDACPAKCAGYESFRQEPTNFSAEVFPKFLIPDTAAQCSAKEAGCEEFTNLEKLAAGGESREDYTFLRLCQKPDDQTTAYYTWEGNDLKGYNLQTWSLRKSNLQESPSDSDPSGGVAPCTNLTYDAEQKPQCADVSHGTGENRALCTKASMPYNPDCREFIDADGNFHYRLYSRTIISTDACTEYRATRSVESDCTSHGGDWINNQCHYFAEATESVACQAAAVGCRAYTGNSARNVQVIVNDDFENGVMPDWRGDSGVNCGTTSSGSSGTGGVCLSTESVSSSGHSLKVIGFSAARNLVNQNGSSMLEKGKAYVLTFWAKGSGDLAIAIKDRVSDQVPVQAFGTVALTTDWKAYSLGPVIYNRTAAGNGMYDSLNLASRATNDHPVFIDNFQLSEIPDSLYVVDGSWKTPAVCDQDPLGQSSPQYMLGCKAYQDRAKNDAYFRSFANICRDEAIGCTAVYDTHNAASPYAQTWSAACTVSTKYCQASLKSASPQSCSSDANCGGTDKCVAACVPKAGETTCPCTSTDRQGSCDIRADEAYCTYDAQGDQSANRSPNGETRVVPNADLAYYVYDSHYSCTDADVGCTELGTKTLDANNQYVTGWTSTYLKNLPDSYNQILCGKSEENCQAYSRSEDGTPVYFKDPGNHLCEFKTNVSLNGQTVDGWFKTGTTTPCYGDYLVSGSFYGIWKNSDSQYSGWVGSCPAAQSQCKEFLDPTDTSAAQPQGKPYYFLKNSRLDTKSCGGQISREKSPSAVKEASACVLFDQSDNPNLLYDTTSSYANSDAQFGALVSPVSGAEGNDTNIIIRATRDRQCAEWDDCRSSEKVYNPSTNEFKDVCTAIAPCTEYQTVGASTVCVRYADSSYTGQVLDDKVYESRPVGWGSEDYSGYAIPNRYPVNELQTISVPATTAVSSQTTESRLAYVSPTPGLCSGSLDFSACGTPNNRGNHGTCLNNQCVWPIDGGAPLTRASDLQQQSAKSALPAADCRAYPSEDAPFPGSVADPTGWDASVADINGGNPRLLGASSAFKGANVCQRRTQKIPLDSSGTKFDYVTYDSCECGYVKAAYGSTTKYFPLNGPDLPYGYCGSGTYEGLECDPNAQGLRSNTNPSCCSKLDDSDPTNPTPSCADDGGCTKLSKTDYVVGFQGQCLERDLSTPINGAADQFACLTWRPTGLVGGSFDIYNLNRTAGYFAPVDRHFYCAQAGNADQLKLGIDMSNSNGDYTSKICYNTGSTNNPNELPGTNCLSDADCKNLTSTNPAKQRNASGQPVTYDGGRCVPKGHCEGNRGATCWNSDAQNPPFSSGFCSDNTTPKNANCVPTNIPDELSDKGPLYQPANRFFGPGVVSQIIPGFRSQGNSDLCYQNGTTKSCLSWPVTGNCTVAADKTGAAWCTFPGLSTTCQPSTDQQSAGGDTSGNDTTATCPISGVHSFQTPLSYGIVGCYEVSDQTTTSGDPLTIQWPYVGPPIYRDQLDSFEIDLAKSIYTVTASGVEPNSPISGLPQSDWSASTTKQYLSPTNPYQKVTANCNDNGNDSHIADQYPDPQHAKSCLLKSDNKWKNDCADRDGSDVFEVVFDKYGALRSLKVTSSDKKNQGTFGISAIAFNFKQACSVVNRVDQPGALGLTQANTEYVNSYRQFGTTNPVPTTDYTQACSPWGAIGLQSQDPPSVQDLNVSSRWTRVTLNPVVNGQEVINPQCTETGYRQASAYDSTSLGKLFHSTSSAWQYTAMSENSVNYGGQLNTPLYSPVGTANYINSGTKPSYNPQIASVDLTHCAADGSCTAQTLGAFTVNGHDKGILVGYGGAYTVTAEFYAWAAHEAMPVIKRAVFWGESLAEEPATIGWYKNHKPFCSPDESEKNAVRECGPSPVGLTCQNDSNCQTGTCSSTGAHFGNTPAACETDPYQFSHTYTCSLDELTNLSVCSVDATTDRATNAPCRRQIQGAWACVYSPDVEVKDNWGSSTKATFSGEIRLYPTTEDALNFQG